MVELKTLEELRTRKEVEDYFKQLGKEITEEEIDTLKQSYEQSEENNETLTLQQLDDIAGGTKKLPGIIFIFNYPKEQNGCYSVFNYYRNGSTTDVSPAEGNFYFPNSPCDFGSPAIVVFNRPGETDLPFYAQTETGQNICVLIEARAVFEPTTKFIDFANRSLTMEEFAKDESGSKILHAIRTQSAGFAIPKRAASYSSKTRELIPPDEEQMQTIQDLYNELVPQ